MRRTVNAVLLLTLFSSCKFQKDEIKQFKRYVSDTLVTHQRYNELYFSENYSSELNLPIIYNGVDSFEIRIWNQGIIEPSSARILRFSQNEWKNFEYEFYQGHEAIDSIRVNRIVSPDIDSILLVTLADSILSIPSQNAIPGFKDNLADGQWFIVEIATKNFYKAMVYHCPEAYRGEENNKRFLNLIEFLNRRFKFYVPVCGK